MFSPQGLKAEGDKYKNIFQSGYLIGENIDFSNGEFKHGEFTELVGEHCAVLIGYDGDYVYLNDPAVSKGVKQPRGKFISNWNKLYNQAIIIN